MIKAEEIRIGNWVQPSFYPGIKQEPFQVTGMFIQQCHSLELRNPEEYNIGHEYIPLTEEWLVKFGFFNNPTHPIFWEKEALMISGPGLVEGSPQTYDSYHPYGAVADIKHVHQLQNLYFALTGTELTIESPATT